MFENHYSRTHRVPKCTGRACVGVAGCAGQIWPCPWWEWLPTERKTGLRTLSFCGEASREKGKYMREGEIIRMRCFRRGRGSGEAVEEAVPSVENQAPVKGEVSISWRSWGCETVWIEREDPRSQQKCLGGEKWEFGSKEKSTEQPEEEGIGDRRAEGLREDQAWQFYEETVYRELYLILDISDLITAVLLPYTMMHLYHDQNLSSTIVILFF